MSEVVTWYENGQPLPWRLAKRDDQGDEYGEVRCETFTSLMVVFGETWAREMPEPLDVMGHG